MKNKYVISFMNFLFLHCHYRVYLFCVAISFLCMQVSLKEVEHHHEAGEPPCRLSREISNAEFRQFIRSNNYEMVFEVLKSKGRMYNLEHQVILCTSKELLHQIELS